MKSRIVFLSESFYRDYPNPPFKEMEQKQNRPYIVFLIELEGHRWVVPFRSHIRHRYAYFTDTENRCEIDYSKAVVVDKPEYIDEKTRPHLRSNEFEALRGNEYAVQKGFEISASLKYCWQDLTGGMKWTGLCWCARRCANGQ